MATTITTTIPPLTVEQAPLEAVTFDFYKDIHKGIRSALFGVTLAAAQADPADADGVAALAGRWHTISGLLVSHAEHEDRFVQPVVEQHAPALAEQIPPVHEALEQRAAALEVLADRASQACADERRLAVHRLYLGLAGFTSTYLEHQEFEEIEVMPALSAVVGVDELIAIDMAIVASLTPEETAQSATIMLPAMNVEDRVELVGAMKEGMPPEAFAAIWGLVETALTPADVQDLGSRLGIA